MAAPPNQQAGNSPAAPLDLAGLYVHFQRSSATHETASMLRVQPIGSSPLAHHRCAPLVDCDQPVLVPDWNDIEGIDDAPWRYHPGYEAVENQNVLIDEDYFWSDKPPLQNLSSALTIEMALHQRNLLLQSGTGYEHVGILVVFGQYSAKGASLPAVMPAVWASAEYAKLVAEKRYLLGLPISGFSDHSMYAQFPGQQSLVSATIRAEAAAPVAGPAAGVNFVA